MKLAPSPPCTADAMTFDRGHSSPSTAWVLFQSHSRAVSPCGMRGRERMSRGRMGVSALLSGAREPFCGFVLYFKSALALSWIFSYCSPPVALRHSLKHSSLVCYWRCWRGGGSIHEFSFYSPPMRSTTHPFPMIFDWKFTERVFAVTLLFRC
jgi:hypothetical protein